MLGLAWDTGEGKVLFPRPMLPEWPENTDFRWPPVHGVVHGTLRRTWYADPINGLPRNYQEDRNKNILTKTTPNSCIAVIHYHVLEMRLIDRNRMLICMTSWIYPPFFVSPGVSPSRKTGAITIKW